MPRHANKLPITTEKQQKFVENLTDENSDSYLNPVKSAQKAGYKLGSHPLQDTAKILVGKGVIGQLVKRSVEQQQLAIVRNESAKERIWRELELCLEECKPHTDNGLQVPGDMTNRIRVIELMGKYHQLWSDKLVVPVEQCRKMSDTYKRELQEIVKMRLLANDVIDQQPDNSPAGETDNPANHTDSPSTDTQYLVDDRSDTDHNCDNPKPTVCKVIDTNDLH